MKTRLLFLMMLIIGFVSVSAKNYIVAVTGTSSGAGTLASPYDIPTAISKAVAGDTVFIRGGKYTLASALSWSKSGTSTLYLNIWAYPGDDHPVFDFRTQVYSSSNQGVKVSGSYIHVIGIIVQGAGDNGMQVTGNNNIIEYCTFRWNCDSGLQMKTGSNNYILNCDSYENFDYESGGIASPDYGGNADGFADKQYTNTGTNTYKSCRSWRNGDDGWDSFEKTGNTVYDSCWCYSMSPATFDMTDNIRFKTDSASWFYQFKNTSGRYVIKNYGNGNGFKLGGNYTANNTTLHHCVSVGNPVKGFDQNNNNGTMTLYNCTSYNNKNNYGFSNSSYGTLIIKNCTSLSSTSSNSFSSKAVTQAYNSWNTGFSCVASDFVSLDYTQMLNDRKSDGSLPEITLLHQTSTSGLIDKGTNVGYSFSGSAPDLGAFEFNVSTAVSTTISDFGITTHYARATGELVVNGPIAAVELFQLSGTKIYACRLTAETLSIPTANWTKGVYLVSVISSNGVSSTKKVLID